MKNNSTIDTSNKLYLRFSVICTMIFVIAFSRFLSPIYNFSPLGALGLFGAAYFAKKWQAFLIPILAIFLSDLFINNVVLHQYYPNFTWFYEGFYWQYGSYLLITLIGILIFTKVNTSRIIGGALLSTILFFLISNFGTWASGAMYPKTLEGLAACYVAGIPFIKGTLMGTLFYSALMFGSFSFVQNQFPALKISRVRV
jgi:hypothetical protein